MSGPFPPGEDLIEEEFPPTQPEDEPKPNGQHPPAKRPPLEFVDPITLHGLPVPPKQWLVPEWIPWRRVTGLYGDGGEGKTTILQQLLTATSVLDRNWLGLPVRKVKSIGVFCEDDQDELHERQNDINQLYDCDFGDLEQTKWLPRLGCDNILMTFNNGRGILTGFWEQLRDDTINFGAQLLTLDTVSDLFGGNEMDRSQVRQFVQIALGGLARAIDGSVVASAHPSQSGRNTGTGESGSTQWGNTFRSRCYLSTPKVENGEEKDQFARVLSRKKANWAKREDTIPLRWNKGVFIQPVASQGILGSIDRKHCRRVFCDLLSNSRPVSANSRSGNYAPKLFAKRLDREGYSAAEFERAMEDLFANKEITLTTYLNSSRHPHEKIVLAGTTQTGEAIPK